MEALQNIEQPKTNVNQQTHFGLWALTDTNFRGSWRVKVKVIN